LAFRFIISKALTTSEKSSDYVQYAELAALPRRKILFSYVIRNTMLPQVTDLGLSLGAIFEGALITEVVFGYPGVGSALYSGIISADYNLIMGVTLFSIVGIATASLLVDLSYPLFDPRVRYS
jgi:peptide/nickel transport system permease protein